MMDEKCPCLTDAQACCGCVSMHCDECHKPMQSKYVQGRFCSNCGRPLKAELQSEFEELKKQNEALTINMNAYGLAIMRMKEDKEALIKNYSECMKDIAREIFEEITDVLKIVKIPCINAEGCVTPMQAGYWAIDPNDFAELKKKYTGEQTDEQSKE